MNRIDLGIADLRPLPGIAADAERWEALRQNINRRVFLRSEGTLVTVGTPRLGIVSSQPERTTLL